MQTNDYHNFQPTHTSRKRENIEWSITYAYNALDNLSPRILLIGDSICHGYHMKVREKLAERANVTFWASSKCVTDPDYFRELDYILDGGKFDVIFYNNGLHSLTTNRLEWEEALDSAVRFIAAKKPEAHLVLTLCTPLSDSAKCKIVKELNAIICKLSERRSLVFLDLFTPMEPLATTEHMLDVYHWKPQGIDMQAEIVASCARAHLPATDGIIQQGSKTGPEGAIQ